MFLIIPSNNITVYSWQKGFAVLLRLLCKGLYHKAYDIIQEYVVVIFNRIEWRYRVDGDQVLVFAKSIKKRRQENE